MLFLNEKLLMMKIKQISFGTNHAAAILADGSIACWGYNGDGQCKVPRGIGPVESIVAGGFHTVALLADGSVVCWGRNTDGQCDVPEDLGSVVSVAAGEYHTVAVLANGSLVSWGDNRYQRYDEARHVFKKIEVKNYCLDTTL
jgi:alpha-tubulin suppressor-like RCC1 family protein